MYKILAVCLGCLLFFSCNKSTKNRWNVNPDKKVEVTIHNISSKFFDQKIPLAQLRQDYPFFFDNSTDSIWSAQRSDKNELNVYHQSTKTFGDLTKLAADLNPLFSRYNYYFPEIKTPTVFTYSSGLQNLNDPVLYSSQFNMMFIAMDGFMGKENKLYDSVKVYHYLRTNMSRDYVPAQVVHAIANDIVPFDPKNQTFLDLMLYEGKKLILADALIPAAPDEFKIGYTPEQLEWSIQNEGSVWNFFVEQNYVFKADKTLGERFLQVAPFSKFNNEIEQDSPGRIGIWIGWQILRKYLDENPEVTLSELIHDMDSQKIFKESKYKPSKTEVTSYRTEKRDGVDELYHYAE